MYFLGRFPWECLACQKLFFNPKRYTRSTRNPMGEVYTGTLTRPAVESDFCSMKEARRSACAAFI